VVGASLTSAGENAGLSNDMIIELTDIFAWDIDFANNLQADDQFTLIYEQTASGTASNRIIAAQFVNQGKTYTAIRYKDKDGIVSYYSPEGRSMRKAFLSAPIDVVRVSSPFSTHRRHPILNRIRAHKGVDYAARTGTPVKAAGDGVIMFHGTQGGYGNMIVIAHGEHYETAYAHLSNFRKDLEDGEIVKQGDVIGYVGQSGLATGPHLHYEFRVDGVHRDPENLDSKQAMRLANEEWQDFHAQTIPVLTQLTQAKAKTLVAKNP
jgi:murein DD-endopeptidase MepM/ murein hydrolase activator NlpD